jgi:glycosyltransferase involved in cell wall biosynthesis
LIVLVAPYSPSGSTTPALGAARKIEAVINILSRRDQDIVLVNTAHNSSVKAPLSAVRQEIGRVSVLELTPRTVSSRRLGKLLNIIDVPAVAEAVLKLGNADLTWLYNGYAFEARFGRLVQRKTGCPVILELEDWHFSRGRGLNPKPFIDWAFWRSLMPHVSYAFAVNSSVANRMGGVGAKVGLFPGIVADGVAALGRDFPPFGSGQGAVVVGYFGGLSVEKGAHQIAALVPQLPSNFKVVVTGSGELELVFRQLQEKYGERLEFHGRVDDARLLELIGSCDVLVNPHEPIESMSNGVFPFKVIEGVASGRLVISTRLPTAGLEGVLQGVEFIDHEFHQLLDAVVNSRSTYLASLLNVRRGAAEASKLFGKEAILLTVDRVCDAAAS